MPKHKKIREIGDVIDEMDDLREEYRALDKESNALKATWKGLEEELLGMLDTMGTDQSRTDQATASLKEEEVATIEDPKKFWTWVMRFKKHYLIQNRISNPAFREEMTNRKDPIPGLRSYVKRSILLKRRPAK